MTGEPFDNGEVTRGQFERAGMRIFGERWKAPLQRALGLSYQQIWRYETGQAKIPRTVELAVKYLDQNPDEARKLANK